MCELSAPERVISPLGGLDIVLELPVRSAYIACPKAQRPRRWLDDPMMVTHLIALGLVRPPLFWRGLRLFWFRTSIDQVNRLLPNYVGFQTSPPAPELTALSKQVLRALVFQS